MSPRPVRTLALVLLAAFLPLAGSSCVGFANAGTLRSTVDPGGASAVSAHFWLNQGRLEIDGGASSLMVGEFTTDSKYDPTVAYNVADQHGTLSVRQTGTRSTFDMIPLDRNWTVQLNDEIPLDLSVETGDARAVLNLDTLTLTHLTLNAGAGTSSISLNGIQRQLTGVELHATAGDIDLQMRGTYDQPRLIEATTLSGDVTLDLGRDTRSEVRGSVRSDSGAITVAVPRESGVEIRASTTSGTIEASGLIERSNGTYVNSAYGTSKTTVTLNVQSTSGPILLKLAS